MRTSSRVLLFIAGVCLAGSLFADTFPGADKIQPELRAKMRATAAKSEAATKTVERRRVIVSLEEGRFGSAAAVNQAFRSNAALNALRAHVDQVQAQVLESLPPQARAHVLTRYQTIAGFSGKFTDGRIRALARHPQVTYIEEMPVHHVMDAEAHPLTRTDELHSLGYTGQDTVIAIIDDGIDHDHAAFGGYSSFPNAKIIGGYDFADYDADPTIDCVGQSHGTATTGVAAGNGGGVTGSAPDAKVVFLKIQKASECGQPSLSGDVIGAIDWIVNNKATYGIDIISMSFGGGEFASVCDSSSPAYANAINNAYAAGLIMLAASGNGGLCDSLSRPACLSNVISVGAVYDADTGSKGYCVSSNSCIGQYHATCAASGMSACFDNSTAGDWVTCYSNSASFLDILSPSTCATTAQAGGGTRTCFGGTSSATPYAAGMAASLLEAAGGSGTMDNDSMRALLVNNGVGITDSKNGLTKPRIDAIASLNALGTGGGGGPTALSNGVPVSSLSGADGEALHFYLDVPAGADSLSFDISGGSGDADLYVNFGSGASTTDYDCRPYLAGNDETCTFASPAAGTWFVMLHGFNAFSGVTLVGSYTSGGGGGAPCTQCDHYSGSLSGSGDADAQPDGTYYFSGAGAQEGWLEGPPDADFDLELYRWDGYWNRVARSISATSSEHISFNGGSGYYYWRIVSYSGNGSYDFWLDRP